MMTNRNPASVRPPAVPGFEVVGPATPGRAGTVFPARHTESGQTVAVTVLPPGVSAAAARALAAVRHPHLARVVEGGEAGGVAYLAEEHLPGGSLATRIRTAGPLPAADAAAAAARVARGVQAAHDAGVSGLDLTPKTIRFDAAGEPKVADLAASRFGGAGRSADVLALGAILYEALTGRPPYRGASGTLVSRLAGRPAPLVRPVGPGVPPELEAVCRRCLAPSTAARYPTAAAVADDLDRFRTPAVAEPAEAKRETTPGGPGGPAGSLSDRKRKWGGVATGLTAAGILFAGGLLTTLPAAPRETVEARTESDAVGVDPEAARREAEAAREVADAARRESEERLRAADGGLTIARTDRDRADTFRTSQYLPDPAGGGEVVSHPQPPLLPAPRPLPPLEITGPLVIRGHAPGAVAVAFAPDGRRVATAGADRVARVWDADTGDQRAEFRGHAGPVWAVAFSPDGRRAVTVGGDGAARVWDADTGKERVARTVRAEPSAAVSFSPDGWRVATAEAGGAVRIWDATTGAVVFTLRGHAGPVRSVAFAPDGARVVTAGDDGSARLWDAETGAVVHELRGQAGPVRAAGFGPDGGRLVTAGADGTLRVWDAETGAAGAALRGRAGRVETVAFGPDGWVVAAAGAGGTARVWDARTAAETLVLGGHDSAARHVAFSPDGRLVAAAAGDGTVRVWGVSRPPSGPPR